MSERKMTRATAARSAGKAIQPFTDALSPLSMPKKSALELAAAEALSWFCLMQPYSTPSAAVCRVAAKEARR